MSPMETYFADLCARLQIPGEIKVVRFLDVRNLLDGWARNRCHANVDALVAIDPQYGKIRGWVVSGGIQLDAHSLVADAQGILRDITFPDFAEHGIRFLTHTGSDDEFFKARAFKESHICLLW